MSQNLDHLERVAVALEQIGVRHAFVGGATIELFLDALAAAQARVTDDVDCIVDTHDRGAHQALEKRLRRAGFVHAAEPGAPICRWRLEGIVVDVMPVDEAVLGFSNPFYRSALDAAEPTLLPSGRAIPCLTLGYTIATKVVAFEDRGRTDPWASKDLEDLVAIFDGGAGPVDAVRALPDPERARACRWACDVIAHPAAAEWVEGHLSRGPGFAGRVARVLERLADVAGLAREATDHGG